MATPDRIQIQTPHIRMLKRLHALGGRRPPWKLDQLTFGALYQWGMAEYRNGVPHLTPRGLQFVDIIDHALSRFPGMVTGIEVCDLDSLEGCKIDIQLAPPPDAPC